MLRDVGVGAGDQDSPLGVVRTRGPDLLAVHDPLVAVPLGAGPKPCQVGAGGRLAEQLAPDLRAAQHLRQPARLLLVCAVRHQRRPRHAEPDGEDVRRHVEARLLLTPDHGLDGRGLAAPVLPRPGDARPAGVGLLDLPGLGGRDRTLVFPLEALIGLSLAQPCGVSLEPGPRLLSERRLFRVVVEVHAGSPFAQEG